MSEYQYYEFAVVDGPISDEGLEYATRCSSRATVSRFRWQNTYHFGSFHGDEQKLLQYYDAHWYLANWGTVCLGLAFPKDCLSSKVLEPYLHGGERHEDLLTAREVGNRLIVWWELNQEGGWLETQGEGILDQLIGIREELIRGDHRALFLGWLADFDPDEWRDPADRGVLLPPIPVGLDSLSPAQQVLIEHFPVDRDALAVAARLSGVTAPHRIPIGDAIGKLPMAEMRALLERVAEGGGTRVMTELNRLTHLAPEKPADQAISCVDFAAQTVEIREARLKKEAEARAEKRQDEEKARRKHLTSVMQSSDSIWAGLDALMDQKVASAYDQAAAQLQELRDAHEQAGEPAGFLQKLTAFRTRYARRPAMLSRIEKLG